MPSRASLVPLLAALAALALAQSSAAATIGYSGGTDGAVVYAAEPGEALSVSVGFVAGCGEDPGGAPLDCVTFYGNAVGWAPAGNCQAQGDGTVWCLLDPDRSGVRVLGGDGDDTVGVLEADLDGFPAAAGYGIDIEGGGGNDRLDGGSGAEAIHGGAGADAIAGRGGSDDLYGDDGDDVLRGDGTGNGNEGLGGGDDRLHGGAGDDTLTGDTPNGGATVGHDLLDGGPGTDTVAGDWFRYDGSGNDEDPPPTVTFDGLANDGRPGEGDDVLDVERIESGVPAGPGPATFVGDDGPNAFLLLFTNGVVSGAGGDDEIAGSDYPDRLDGGAGDDSLSGGFGDDDLTGGPGRDDIAGDRTAACEYGPIYGTCTIGSGNDTIHAQDGEADRVDCGPGADVAYVDPVDTAVACEDLRVAAAPGGAGSGSAGGHAAPPTPGLAVPRQSLASVARHRYLAVACRLPRPGRCTVRATIAAGVARRLGLRPRRRAAAYPLGGGSARLARPGRRTIRIPLSRRTARALRRARSLRVRLLVTASYRDGRRGTAAKRLTLRR